MNANVAIRRIKMLMNNFEDVTDFKEFYFESLEKAIDVLKQSTGEGEYRGLIYRQDAIDMIMGQPPEAHYPSWYAEQIKVLPPAPLYTPDELQTMQDLEWAQLEKMYELGKEEGVEE